jgi:hypothetical protein
MLFLKVSLPLLLLLLLRCHESNALQPFLGGTLSWSIADGFEQRSEDRIVNFTLVSAFIRSPDCNYSVGELLTCRLAGSAWCGSDITCAIAARHGVLNIAPLSQDGAVFSDGKIAAPNVPRVLELDDTSGAAWAVGIMHIAARAPGNASAMLAWLSTHPLDPEAAHAHIPICTSASAVVGAGASQQAVCSFSFAALDGDVGASPSELSGSIAAYWDGLPALNDTSITSPARAVLRTFVPLCTAGGGPTGCSSRNGTLENRHAPIAPFPPLAPAPVPARAYLSTSALDPARGEAFMSVPAGSGGWYAAPLPPFRLVAADADGSAMAQFVAGDPSGPQKRAAKCYPAARAGRPPAPPAWPDSLCRALGPSVGRPCSERKDCGPPEGYGPPTAIAAAMAECDAAAGCGEIDGEWGGGGGCSSGAGSQFKLDFTFPSTSTFNFGAVALARSVIFTMELSKDGSNRRTGSWRNGTAATVTAFSSYASDCGPVGAAPVFGPGIAAAAAAAAGASGDGEGVDSDASCVTGRACEVAAFAAVGAGADDARLDGIQVRAYAYQVRYSGFAALSLSLSLSPSLSLSLSLSRSLSLSLSLFLSCSLLLRIHLPSSRSLAP